MPADAIDREIIRNALNTVALEMTVSMERTSRSPIVNESRDFSTAILDSEGRAIAQGLGSPVLMAAIKHSVRAILDEFPDYIHPGDLFINNDPFSGGSHLGDTTIALPVFHNGSLAFIVSVRSHLPDGAGGGARPGGMYPAATEIFEEGIRFPPFKLCEGGELRGDRFDWVVRNTRFKAWTIGDVSAMIASCQVAETRIRGLIEKYGFEAVKDACEYALDYAERLFIAEVESWADGTYRGVAYMDSDGFYEWDIKVQVDVTIDGGRLVMDFSGADPQTRGFANSGAGNTLSYAFIALCSVLDETIPKNDGIFRAVTTILPEGTLLNPTDGSPTGLCTLHPGAEIAQALTLALSQAVPEKVGHPWDTRVKGVISGTDPRSGNRYVAHPFVTNAAGPGGTYGLDGWGGGSGMRGGMAYTTAEMYETHYPHRVEQREFMTDSCGPGKWRGGPGTRTVIKILGHTALANYMVWGGRHPCPPLCGGVAGRPNQAEFLYKGGDSEHLAGGESLERWLDNEDAIQTSRGGGGGWGDPLERDPAMVREDVLDEYLSVAGAHNDYGVVIDPETLDVDEDATRAVRHAMREVAVPAGAEGPVTLLEGGV